jgi:spermidine/putrescine transport system substrate-binding protein
MSHDGSSLDLERILVSYLAEERLTRRDLLHRISVVGATVALAPIIAACGTSAASASPAGSGVAQSAAPSGSAAPATATPEPTPAPTAEAELFIYNWAQYMGDKVIPSFEKATGVKVTMDFFDNYDTMYAKLGQSGGGYDIAFPTSVDIPSFVQRGLIQPLMLDLVPNRGNLGTEWQDPGYDPGNAHSMPYMWWTTGVAYDSQKVSGSPDSWDLLWNAQYKNHISILDDVRETFAAALFRLGKEVNTTVDADLDAALALLQEQKPLVRIYTTDDIGVLSAGDAWVCHAWGSDVYQVIGERPSVKFYIPKEGGVRGSDTAVVLSGAKHPVAANLFINHLLDAKVSAENTDFIGYMGPNAAAREFISPKILADPNVNPDQAVVAKLQELLDLGTELDKYTQRWNRLRAGN